MLAGYSTLFTVAHNRRTAVASSSADLELITGSSDKCNKSLNHGKSHRLTLVPPGLPNEHTYLFLSSCLLKRLSLELLCFTISHDFFWANYLAKLASTLSHRLSILFHLTSHPLENMSYTQSVAQWSTALRYLGWCAIITSVFPGFFDF